MCLYCRSMYVCMYIQMSKTQGYIYTCVQCQAHFNIIKEAIYGENKISVILISLHYIMSVTDGLVCSSLSDGIVVNNISPDIVMILDKPDLYTTYYGLYSL